MIKILAKKLSAFTEFVDWVLVEAEFNRGSFVSGAEVVKIRSAMAVVRACSSEAELIVKLIRPRAKLDSAVSCRVHSAEKIWRTFTESEVAMFVAEVGDGNQIHRMNPPIVPGLLILETLLARADFSACRSIKLKFKNFVAAGEPLTLRSSESRFEICSAGVRKVLVVVS